MKKKHSIGIIFLVALIGTLTYTQLTPDSVMDLADLPGADISEEGAPTMASFEGKATMISFEELAKSWSEKGIDLYLPTQLPQDLKPVGVWVEIIDGKTGSLALFLYSREGRDRIASAELVLEVYPASGIPFTNENRKGRFTHINDWNTYLLEKAPVGWKEYNEEYGENAILIDVYIEPLNYLYRGAPFLTIDDLVNIVESMEITN